MINQTGFDDDQLRILLNKYGPISGALDVNMMEMRYCKGHYHGTCGKQVNHAITIAGYTEDDWIIKNSWSTNWGDEGYFYLPRGENKCAINILIGVPFIH